MLVAERNRNYYVIVGQIFHPIGRKGINLNLLTGYYSGEIDSIQSKKYYYEIKFNWPASRRINLSSWWRQSWYKFSTIPDRQTKEFDLQINYRRGRLFLSVEYWLFMDDENQVSRKDQRIYVKARRYF